jgi:hypothetical protein
VSVIRNSSGETVAPYVRTVVVRAWGRLTAAVNSDIEAEQQVEAAPGYMTRLHRLYTLARAAEQRARYVQTIRANLGFDLTDWPLDQLWETHPANIADTVADGPPYPLSDFIVDDINDETGERGDQ